MRKKTNYKIKIQSEVIKYFKGYAAGLVLSFLYYSMGKKTGKAQILPSKCEPRIYRVNDIVGKTSVSEKTVRRSLIEIKLEGFLIKDGSFLKNNGSKITLTQKLDSLVLSPNNKVYIAETYLIEVLGFATGMVFSRIISSSYNSQDGRFFSSNEELAERSGLSLRAVERAISLLRSKDLVHTSVEESSFGRVRWILVNSKNYQLLISKKIF